MCQILQTTIPWSKRNAHDTIFSKYDLIKELLCEKGGETFSFYAFNSSHSKAYDEILVICNDLSEYDIRWEEFEKLVNKANWQQDNEIIFVFFSRQAPEMESEPDDIEPAPYFEKSKAVWLHGTVSNLPEIEKELNKKFKVDSQAIAYANELLANHSLIIKGVYAAYVIDKESGEESWIYNGIGLWNSWYTIDGNNADEFIWSGTTPDINRLSDSSAESEAASHMYPYYASYALYDDKISNKDREIYYVAFSGGMDIVMSSYVNIADSIIRVSGNLEIYSTQGIRYINKGIKYVFTYFDYGAQAREQEIESLNKFYKYVSEKFPMYEYEIKIIDVKQIFSGLSKIANYQSKLVQDNSKGDERETEDNLAYVPYRNTEFALLLGALIDDELEKGYFLPSIIYGLNLTEMGVYVDNTEIWAQSIKQAIEYGGKNYKNVEIITPFVDTTKTNMLAFMIKKYGYDTVKELLDISFSCYYPDENGNACGKCGSCILREKALARAQKRLKKIILNNGGAIDE